MCLKIQCDKESWKVFGFWVEINKTQVEAKTEEVDTVEPFHIY